MNYITTIALAALFAVVMGWLPLTPVMGDPDTQDLKRQSRFERGAQELCGINASFTEIGNGVIQCATKHGRKTRKGEIK